MPEKVRKWLIRRRCFPEAGNTTTWNHSDHTLQTSDLVHEAYLKLEAPGPGPSSAADHARARRSSRFTVASEIPWASASSADQGGQPS